VSEHIAGPSTRNLVALPTPASLQRTLQSTALLDAILCDEPYLRTHHFDAFWSTGVTMAKMDNGSGDHYYVAFCDAGVFVKGFDHESPMSPYAAEAFGVWPGLLDQVPAEFAEFVAEPAFEMEDITCCLWWATPAACWQIGNVQFPDHRVNDPDGSAWMLRSFTFDAASYCDWANDYFDVSISVQHAKRVFAHEPLTPELVHSINPTCEWDQVCTDADMIGFLIRP
jgi:hypothetical protein